MHITGVYTAQKEMALYVNGELVSALAIKGSFTYPSNAGCILGMVRAPGKPSDTIRTWGTVGAYYGLDGIIDEIKVFDVGLDFGKSQRRFFEAIRPECRIFNRGGCLPLKRTRVILGLFIRN